MRTALALSLFLASPAFAEVRAEALWAELQRLAAMAGTPLTAEIRRAGADLILDRPALDLGTALDPLSLRMERVVLRDNPDGSVSVLLPDRFPLTLGLPPSIVATDPDSVTFTVAAPGLDISVEGIGQGAAFDILAPSISLTLDPVVSGGDEVSLTLALADLSLDHRQDLGMTLSTVETTLALGTLHADGLIAVADGERVTYSVDLSAIAGSLFLDVDPGQLQQPQATLKEILSGMSDGQAIRATLDHGPVALALTVTDDQPGLGDMRLSSASGRALLRVDQAGVEVEVTSSGTSFLAVIDDPALPVDDLDMGYGELAFGAALGLSGATEPEAFAVFGRLDGLTMSDPIWDELDPAAAFPRDPIFVALALSGLMEEKPRTAAVPGGDAVPVDILSMSLDEMRLSGLGVDLTGEGALSFDNSDVVTFDGLPEPTGSLSFMATGINALFDRVVAAGLVPPQDLSGLRFALAFIAKPGDGPDNLTSRIEFRDKSLYLNGVKMR